MLRKSWMLRVDRWAGTGAIRLALIQRFYTNEELIRVFRHRSFHDHSRFDEVRLGLNNDRVLLLLLLLLTSRVDERAWFVGAGGSLALLDRHLLGQTLPVIVLHDKLLENCVYGRVSDSLWLHQWHCREVDTMTIYPIRCVCVVWINKAASGVCHMMRVLVDWHTIFRRINSLSVFFVAYGRGWMSGPT